MVMYWQKKTKISCIANAMPRDLYGKIRSNLKVVDDSKVTPAQKKEDKLWKVRKLIECGRSRCLELSRPTEVCVDEMKWIFCIMIKNM